MTFEVILTLVGDGASSAPSSKSASLSSSSSDSRVGVVGGSSVREPLTIVKFPRELEY